jgi:hypothetical protein
MHCTISIKALLAAKRHKDSIVMLEVFTAPIGARTIPDEAMDGLCAFLRQRSVVCCGCGYAALRPVRPNSSSVGFVVQTS